MDYGLCCGINVSRMSLTSAFHRGGIVDDHRLHRKRGRSFGCKLRIMLVILAMMGGMLGCGNQQEETSSANPSPVRGPSGLLRLTPEESARMVLDVTPKEYASE